MFRPKLLFTSLAALALGACAPRTRKPRLRPRWPSR